MVQIASLLKELKSKGYIDYGLSFPEWSNSQTIEIKIKDRKGLLNYKTYRMQKVIDEEIVDKAVPSSVNELRDKVRSQIRFQKIENPRLTNNAAINRIFKSAWYDVNIQRKAEGFLTKDIPVDAEEFRVAMLTLLPPNLHDRFVTWYDVNILSEYSNLKYRRGALGNNTHYAGSNINIEDNLFEFLSELNDREGYTLEDLASKEETNERELTSSDLSYLQEFGVHATPEEASIINKALPVVGRRKSTLLPENLRNSLKKYNRLFSTIPVNSEHGKYNQRDNYIITTETIPIFENGNFIGTQVTGMNMKLKGPDNLVNNDKKSLAKIDKHLDYNYNNKKIKTSDIKITRNDSDINKTVNSIDDFNIFVNDYMVIGMSSNGKIIPKGTGVLTNNLGTHFDVGFLSDIVFSYLDVTIHI